MASGNVIVTKTVNRTTFETDKASYGRAVKQIRSLKREWEKASDAVTSPKKDPAKAYDKSAQQMRMVNKRLAETRMREQTRATNHAIAMAKKEARAKEAVAKVSSSRIRQHVKGMTAKNPGAAEMRKFYQQQEREAKKASRRGGAVGLSTPTRLNISRVNSLPLPKRTGFGTGMVGNPNSVYSPETIARQNAEMVRHHRMMSRQNDKRQTASARSKAQSASRAASIDDVISQQQIRLSSRYGRGYAGALGRNGGGAGIQDLNKQFRAGTMSVGQYRASIAALERQFRSAQGSAGSFSSTLKGIQGSLAGATAGYGAFAAGKSVLQQGQFFQGLDATMLMVSDSSEEAAKRIQFVRDQSYSLGLSLKEASQGYVQMSIAADGVISKQQNDDLFKAFSEYSTALQVDPVKYQRGITAIQQMMGKGQIMAEELKQQLAEGIPGSLQVFVKASQEAFNDTSIDVEKLMDMMQKGELKAAKVLPFVAKYYAEAARRGGALAKAQDSNRVAMQRLGQTWIDFQNKIFEGRFGEVMTKVFRDLATILSSNGELATNLGDFFGNMIEGAWDAVLNVHDAFVFLDRMMGYYMNELGIKGDTMKELFDWAGYVAGVLLFVGALTRVLKVLSKIAGLRGAIAGIRGALGGMPGGGAITTGGSGGSPGGPMGPNSGPRTPWGTATKGAAGATWIQRLLSGAKTAGKGALPFVKGAAKNPWVWAGLATEEYLSSDSVSASATARDNAMQPLRDATNPLARITGGDATPMMALLWNSLFGKSKPNPNIDPDALVSGAQGPSVQFPFPASAEQMKGHITLEIKAGDLKQYITAVVDENDRLNFNMLMQGGPN